MKCRGWRKSDPSLKLNKCKNNTAAKDWCVSATVSAVFRTEQTSGNLARDEAGKVEVPAPVEPCRSWRGAGVSF